tara:strand:+ start:145 stop:531 length:387 start_codon:yes stop_codon:yes gene_type:complete
MSDRISNLKEIQNEALELFKKKNQDYGDAFANYGAIGVIVRIGDKISRLQSITNSQISLINTETLRDTLIDLHNYSAMAIMLLDEKVPTEIVKYPRPISSPEKQNQEKQNQVLKFINKKSNSAPNLNY